ncbi:hypothetical protein CFP56_015789 [Quercus suber]|uniref:Uncharacterized protein n=1 Tax=Quercus suber TaxID=58331 RepID=A0AAW0KPN1_QUESU
MRLTWVSGDEKPQQVQYGDGMSQNSVVTTFTQDDMCSSFYERQQSYVNSEPSEVVPNQAPVVELSEQGPAREVQPATVTKNGVEGSNGGEEADLVTDVTESNEGGRLSESNLEPELLPINDPISNGLSPIKAPLIVGKEVNAMSLNREAVDLAKLFEIKINEIDEILNIPSQTLVFNGYSMLGNYDGNNSHANPSRPIMENMVHDPEVNAPPTSKVTGSHAAIRLSTRGRGNKHFMKKAVVPRANRGGGLVLFWKESVEVSVEGGGQTGGGGGDVIGEEVVAQALKVESMTPCRAKDAVDWFHASRE